MVLAVSTFFVSGCMYEPDHFTTERVQVEEKPFSDTIAASQFDIGAAEAMATHYRKHGDGPLELVIAYDPKSPHATAMKAADEGARLSKLLRQNGVQEVKTSIMPVADGGDEMKALFSYNAVNALAPKDCTLMRGVDTRTIEADKDYKLGCTIETMYARQIARPKDLKGQGANDLTTDGRRASNIVEGYRSGVQNKPLEGENASGD
jgi:type IV pilus biogenesis protein CpaD/CtpE